MKWVILPFLFMLAANVYSATIDDLISSGYYSDIYDSLIPIYGDDSEKPEFLFVTGLGEQSGESAIAALKEFIKQKPNEPYLADWARLVIGKYYLSQDLHVVAKNQFEEINASSRFSPEASYLAARCYLLADEYDKSIKPFQVMMDNLVGKKVKGKPVSPNYYYYWAVLGQAQAKMALGKYGDAEKLYDQILEPELGDDVFPLALLDLIALSQKIDKPEKADHYRALYKEQYGSPPKALAEAASLDTADDSVEGLDEKTDKILGNKYYIQIGVFANKQNADNTSAAYKKSGYRSSVEEFVKGGKKFYRVILGSYASKQEANYVKGNLEKAANEKYALIVR